MKRMGFAGYLLTSLASVLVTLVIVDSELTQEMQSGCERRQPIFREFESFMWEAAAAREKDGNAGVAKSYRDRAARVAEHIVDDCKEEYPGIFKGFFTD